MTIQTQVKQGLAKSQYMNPNPELVQDPRQLKDLPNFESPYYMAETPANRASRVSDSPYSNVFVPPTPQGSPGQPVYQY